MLITASQFTPRARSLPARHTTTARALGAGCTQSFRQRQQSRGFRWGIWSNLDDDFAREFRRQQRMLKRQYSERLNRRLSWEKHPFSDDSRHALKRMMKSYWLSSYPSDRCRDETESIRLESTDRKTGSRPGQTIEDVERGAMDHLIFGENAEPSAPRQVQNHPLKRRKIRKVKHTSGLSYDQPVEVDDYIIDPITNRKVAKQPTPSSFESGEDIPAKTFKDYRSQFTRPDVTPEQVSPSGGHGSPHSQRDSYTQSSGSHGYEHSQTEASHFMERGPVVSPKIVKAASWVKGDVEYDLPRYKSFKDSELNANLASNVDELITDHSTPSRHRNAPEKARETFGDLQPPQESSDESGYKSAVADEIASRVEVAQLRLINQTHLATDETGDVRSIEPVNDIVEQDDSSQHRGKPLGFREEFVKPEVLRRYQSAIHPVEPGDFPESTVEDLRAKYDAAELKQYTSVRYVEPDENRVLTSKGPEYYAGSSTYNESAGGPSSPLGEFNDLVTQRAPQNITYQESEGPAVAQMEQDKEAFNAGIEYDNSQHIEHENGPDGHLTGKEALEEVVSVKQGHGRKAGTYQYKGPEEPEDEMVADPKAPASLSPQLERLASVKQGQGQRSNYKEMLELLMSQHEKLSDAHDHEATMAIKLAKAKNQEVDEPQRKLTGSYVRDFPEEFEKSWTQTLSSMPAKAETMYETEAPIESEAMDGGLEGAFGRPSPSRIEPALDRCGNTKAAVGQHNHGTEEPEGPETTSTEEAGDGTQPLESARDAKDGMQINTEIQGDTSKAGKDQVKSNTADESLEETSTTSETEPVLYKILAYDPIMQNINIAETTSFVPDFTSALSPADALLRLSHPTKFFPHFASLEAEGFEIASGSGDVLVFRKVRPSKPGQAQETRAESTSPAVEQPPSLESSINPIDMTGRPIVVSPASANFASPTGYVKYENLPETEADKLPPPPPPRVTYNINLRREEPVFSGPKQRVYGDQKKRKSLGHRLLIGGVWVAGVSYGLGVVSEYFTTGGMDGMGPQSL